MDSFKVELVKSADRDARKIGDYRLLYEVDLKNKIITVYHIRHRKDAYK